MSTPRPLRFLCIFATIIALECNASLEDVQPPNGVQNLLLDEKNKLEDKKLEVLDGVYLNIPRDNSSRRLFSFEVDTSPSAEEGRGKKKKMLMKILPLFLMPFIIQSTIIPLFLGMLKFMLLKSLLIGKLALVLIMLNAFKNSNSFKGRDAEMASAHYGYQGLGMEFGSYFN